MLDNSRSYLVVSADLTSVGTLASDELQDLSERHRVRLPSTDDSTPLRNLRDHVAAGNGIDGVLFTLHAGIPSRHMMKASAQMLGLGCKVFYWWPREEAVEVVDRDRLRSFRKHWIVYMLAIRIERWHRRIAGLVGRSGRFALRAVRSGHGGRQDEGKLEEQQGIARAAAKNVYPVPFVGGQRIREPAVYLRTDFWAPLNSGGSYGHTCYFAKALAQRCDELVCLMANRFALLDDMGIRQIVVSPGMNTSSEADCILANAYYYEALKPVLEYLRPAFIYERLCLGNYAGARLSQDLGIPYIVEYNGSELSMKRSFEGTAHAHEAFFLEIERLAFDQATVVSVISERVREDLLRRGVSEDKILVSWNAVDPDAYKPASDAERLEVRTELGCTAEDRVICFTGTFGGWHGIDVLAAAMPRICRASSRVKFLLIGDGAHKTLVDESIQRHSLQKRVIDCGRVEQKAASRLMAAADVFVSPHSRNMVDSPFFGSPTKLFEYMAYGRGIVASDLEQLADILSPAFRVADMDAQSQVRDEQALLCKPGDVDEFVAAVVKLANDRQFAEALGFNARKGIENRHTWAHRVDSLWAHLLSPVASARVHPN